METNQVREKESGVINIEMLMLVIGKRICINVNVYLMSSGSSPNVTWHQRHQPPGIP